MGNGGSKPDEYRRSVAMIRSAQGSRTRRRPRLKRGERVLHLVGALFTMAGKGGLESDGGTAAASDRMRRRRQRVSMARRLLDPLPAVLRPESQQQERFWRVLRWGGAGLILGWLLGR